MLLAVVVAVFNYYSYLRNMLFKDTLKYLEYIHHLP
jgi:hypothetical protein